LRIYDPEEVNEWEPVHMQDELQKYIQKRNITHFRQAHGTPFTVEPLNKLNWAANSLEAKEVLKGAIPIFMAAEAPYTLKILKYSGMLLGLYGNSRTVKKTKKNKKKRGTTYLCPISLTHMVSRPGHCTLLRAGS
jgi:hypothetical protein